MATANNSNNHNHHANNHSRPSLQSQSPNLANHNPSPKPTAGNGLDSKNPNPSPAHFNRNNSSLRLFCDWLDKAEKNNHNASSSSSAAMAIEGSEEDSVLSKSEFLTREEVLRRRSRRMKQLAKVYRDYYWAMMEELKLKHKEFYWEYGKSPFQEDEDAQGDLNRKSNVTGTNMEENINGKLGLGLNVNRCEVHACKMKAMALTLFCHTHILSDAKQKLYKGCTYVTKSSPTGPTYCMKPVLRSTVPLLCSQHLEKAEKHVSKALKKAGLTATSKSKVAPKLHVVVAEFVHQIQAKRRIGQKALVEAVESKEDKSS